VRRLNRGRPVYLAAVLILLASGSTACKRAKRNPGALAPEQDAPLASVVNVNDPAASPQLVRGFYGLEAGLWRWTMKRFEVALKPPPGSAQNGGRLTLKLTIPEVISSRLGPVTVSGTINGLALPPETFVKPGDYVYAHDVPASALKDDAVIAAFASDKAIPPSPDDARELALIAVSVALESK
jgi:hypothetical protein